MKTLGLVTSLSLPVSGCSKRFLRALTWPSDGCKVDFPNYLYFGPGHLRSEGPTHNDIDKHDLNRQFENFKHSALFYYYGFSADYLVRTSSAPHLEGGGNVEVLKLR